MGKSGRDNILGNKSENPGPGSYLVEGSSKPVPIKMGAKLQGNLINNSFIPGPGSYNPNTDKILSKVSYGYSMPARNEKLKTNQPDIVGPGSYNIETKFSGGTSKFGKSSRTVVDIKSKGNLPGPGQYSEGINFLNSKNNNAYKFGRSTKNFQDVNKSDIPGPGSYLSPDLIGKEASKVSIAPKRPDTAIFKAREVPGPGSYQPKNVYNNPPGFKMGTEKRSEFGNNSKDVPGAGSYNINGSKSGFISSSPAWKMGGAKRGDFTEKNNNPGPGSYIEKSRIGEGQKVGLSGKFKTLSKDEVPGPGAYTPNLERSTINQKSQGFKYGKEERGKAMSHNINNPGPGSYNFNPRKAGPSFGFGSSGRTNAKSDVVPGPGQYLIPSKVGDVPKYLIPNKSNEFKYVLLIWFN